MSQRNSRHRDYCFTINNYTQEEIDVLEKLKEDCQYIVWGKEIAPSTGTPHLQGYIYFQNQRYFNSIKNTLPPGTHIEPRMKISTPKRVSDYCKKGIQSKEEWDNQHELGPMWGVEADFTEYGDLPLPQGKRTDIDIIREELNEGGGMRGVVRVATNLQQIKIAEMILRYEEPKRDWMPHVRWFWGPTRTGKSRLAHEIFAGKDFHRKTVSTGKWWDGYDAHEYVIFDDFTLPATVKEYKYWLDVLDRYECRVEVKGTTRQLLFKEIIITSSKSPQELFQYFEQDGAEFIERIHEIREFTKENK